MTVDASAVEIAAETARLIMLSCGLKLTVADADELERTVLAQVQAIRSLRRYPLHNSDEPMLVTGKGPGELL